MKLTMNVSPVNGKIPYEQYLDILQAAGFDAVDFMLNDLVFDHSEMQQANTVEYCERIKRGAIERGMTVEQTHAPFQFKNWEKIIFSKKGNMSFYVVIMKSKVHVTFLYLYNILPILGVKNRRKLGQI